jgi:hypothetical protein
VAVATMGVQAKTVRSLDRIRPLYGEDQYAAGSQSFGSGKRDLA